MQQDAILAPMLGLMLLTFFVWAYMYFLRLGYIARHGVNPQDLATPEKGWVVLPEAVNLPAHNLRNLAELPVVHPVDGTLQGGGDACTDCVIGGSSGPLPKAIR